MSKPIQLPNNDLLKLVAIVDQLASLVNSLPKDMPVRIQVIKRTDTSSPETLSAIDLPGETWFSSGINVINRVA